MLWRNAGALIMAPLLFFMPVAAVERVPGAARSESSVAQLEWQKISGQVEAKDLETNRLRLRDKNGNRTHVVVDEDVQIFRNWRLVVLDDVRIDDQVTLRREVMRSN